MFGGGFFEEALKSLLTTEDLSKAKEAEANAARIDKWKKDNSLNCRKCGRLAEPIEGTTSRYRCSCGSQFAGAPHSKR